MRSPLGFEQWRAWWVAGREKSNEDTSQTKPQTMQEATQICNAEVIMGMERVCERYQGGNSQDGHHEAADLCSDVTFSVRTSLTFRFENEIRSLSTISDALLLVYFLKIWKWKGDIWANTKF